MPKFVYKARTPARNIVEGVLEADDTAVAVRDLGKMGYFPIWLEKQTQKTQPTLRASFFGTRIENGAISACLRQLSDLIEAGLPLKDVLHVTADQTSDHRLKTIIGSMEAGVQSGKTLSMAVGEFGDVFSPFYTQLIFAGETGGMLGPILSRLADYAERKEDLEAQIKAAIAYPAFIVVVGFLTISFLLCVVIPRLSFLFSEFRQSLPLATRILLSISDAARHDVGRLFVGITGLCTVSAYFWRQESWRARRDRWALKIPALRSWILDQEVAQFSRTLGSLLEGGVPILPSIDISAQTLRNRMVRQSVVGLKSPVSDGVPLSQSLRAIGIFPAYVCNLIAVGEEGGKLPSSLLKIADSYDKQAARRLKVVMSLLEPTLILVIGVVLGSVVISVMLPIFDINTLIH